MAASVLVFHDHMRPKIASPPNEPRIERKRKHAKHAALLAMADKIEADTTTALHEVDVRTTQ